MSHRGVGRGTPLASGYQPPRKPGQETSEKLGIATNKTEAQDNSRNEPSKKAESETLCDSVAALSVDPNSPPDSNSSSVLNPEASPFTPKSSPASYASPSPTSSISNTKKQYSLSLLNAKAPAFVPKSLLNQQKQETGGGGVGGTGGALGSIARPLAIGGGSPGNYGAHFAQHHAHADAIDPEIEGMWENVPGELQLKSINVAVAPPPREHLQQQQQLPYEYSEDPNVLLPKDVLSGFQHTADLAKLNNKEQNLLGLAAEMLVSASTYPGSYDNWSERITAALKEYNFSDPSLVYFYENLFEMLIHWAVYEPGMRIAASKMCQELIEEKKDVRKIFLTRFSNLFKELVGKPPSSEEEAFLLINLSFFLAESFVRVKIVVEDQKVPLDVLRTALYQLLNFLLNSESEGIIITACKVLKWVDYIPDDSEQGDYPDFGYPSPPIANTSTGNNSGGKHPNSMLSFGSGAPVTNSSGHMGERMMGENLQGQFEQQVQGDDELSPTMEREFESFIQEIEEHLMTMANEVEGGSVVMREGGDGAGADASAGVGMGGGGGGGGEGFENGISQ